MNQKIKNLGTLFLVFLKIGAFTFGGGYAMIPLIQREIVEKRHYIEESEILDMLAVSESTPGPVAVNTATFVGYRIAGPAGAAAATLGVVVPSFLIILVISYFLRQFESFKIVKYAFNGIRVAVLALMLNALATLWRQSPKGALPYAIMGLSFLSVVFLKINVILVMIACAGIGLTGSLIAEKEGRKK